MDMRSTFALALIATALWVPALAQQPAAADGATNTAVPGAATPVQSAVAPLVAPRAAELNAAGIQKIVARTGRQWRDIQVLTTYGPIYFAWPKNVSPVTFEIEVGNGGAVAVRASDYIEANKARYAAAFDAVIPEALRQARDVKAHAEIQLE